MPSAAKVLSLVTFFGPAKKVTRLPAGTGELKGLNLRANAAGAAKV
jgi:hypothetical protein